MSLVFSLLSLPYLLCEPALVINPNPPTGLPWWLRRQSICPQWGRPGFNPWVGKIPWRRKWQPTAVFLPGKFHGLRSLVGYSPWGQKESDTTQWLHFPCCRVCLLVSTLKPSHGQKYLLHCEEQHSPGSTQQLLKDNIPSWSWKGPRWRLDLDHVNCQHII